MAVKKKRLPRSADADKYLRRQRRQNVYYGGWVAPLQGAQFSGLVGAVGEGAVGSGGDSGAGDGGGGDGGGV